MFSINKIILVAVSDEELSCCIYGVFFVIELAACTELEVKCVLFHYNRRRTPWLMVNLDNCKVECAYFTESVKQDEWQWFELWAPHRPYCWHSDDDTNLHEAATGKPLETLLYLLPVFISHGICLLCVFILLSVQEPSLCSRLFPREISKL